jgi:Icc-related predicted phosphoesterase
MHVKMDYYDSKKNNIEDIMCNYGHCNKPILEEALERNMNIHILNSMDSVYVYNYSRYEMTNEVQTMTKDILQEIMIKSQGIKLPEMNEKIKLQITSFTK